MSGVRADGALSSARILATMPIRQSQDVIGASSSARARPSVALSRSWDVAPHEQAKRSRYFPASRLPAMIAASNPRLSLIAFTCAFLRADSCRM